jgi:hypothetical protein
VTRAALGTLALYALALAAAFTLAYVLGVALRP